MALGGMLLSVLAAGASAQSLFPTGEALVAEVRATDAADIVVLAGGFDQGFRQGMRCEVRRDGEVIAVLVIADVGTAKTAGLILDLPAGQSIQPGDLVRLQTFRLN
ncbi:MAG: hypothetical protein JJT96_06530 [Opitutales bacterium]|nr:hypothetical protein [Opitutales bacterium]